MNYFTKKIIDLIRRFNPEKAKQTTGQAKIGEQQAENLHEECYQFQFEYFDSWRMKRLKRYLDWQLPEKDLQVQLGQYSFDEYKCLASILTEYFKKCSKTGHLNIADFSSGLGRSTVFFKNMFGLDNARFFLFDGNKKIYGPKRQMNDSQRNFHVDVKQAFDKKTSFYTDFELVDCFLESNAVSQFQLVNLAESDSPLNFSSFGKMDLLYSFHAIGYHWEISAVFDYYCLDDVIRSGGLLVFGLRRENDPHGFGDDQYDLIEGILKRGYKKVDLIEGTLLQRFLVLRKL